MTLWCPHHDAHTRVLAGPDLDHLTETTRDALPDDAVELRSFWVDPEGEPVLLIAGDSGPELHIDGTRHRLRDGFEVEVLTIDDRRRMAIVTVGGAKVATLSYEVPPSTDGWWEEDGFTDFFAWLRDKRGNERFLDFWTQATPVS